MLERGLEFSHFAWYLIPNIHQSVKVICMLLLYDDFDP